MTVLAFLTGLLISTLIIIGVVDTLFDLAKIFHRWGKRIFAWMKRMYLRRFYPPPRPDEVWRLIKSEEIQIDPDAPAKDLPKGSRLIYLASCSLRIKYNQFEFEGSEDGESVTISLVACPKAGTLEMLFADGELQGARCSNWELWQISWPEGLNNSYKYHLCEIGRFVREAAASARQAEFA
ncbi:hypothetical protein D4R52_01740 [bacterium]|nr:MAG: hypothetical protein D4R52_01740 [bacterium]